MTKQYAPRTLEPIINKASNAFKVVMVSGMRQVGKSTLLEHLASEQRQYVTLDNSRQLLSATESPETFFRLNPAPRTIDEIQLAPQLFRSLKETVDQSDMFGQYWTSGSQRLSLMAKVTEALPGRLISFDLFPFSIYEREGKGLLQTPFIPGNLQTNLPIRSSKECWDLIFQGAWPGVVDKDAQVRDWFFESLVSLYLSKDVAALAQVDKTIQFRKFLKALAIRSGQELRLQPLAEAAGVQTTTIKRWLSIAEASGLIILLPPFFSNIDKQLVKSPKVYMTDTGLIAHLLGIQTPEEMQTHANQGNFFETFVVMEIIKSWAHNGKKPDFYFYRDNKGMEIDLLIHANGKYYPVEIKSKSVADSHDAKWLTTFEKQNLPVGQSVIICQTDAPYYVAKNVLVHSIWAI